MNDDDFEVWTDLFECINVSCIKCDWSHRFNAHSVGLDDLIGVASTHECA